MNDPILRRPASRARARIAALALTAAGICTVQGDQSIANQAGAAFRSDLNNELQALVTFSRGTSAPGTTYAGQQWDDSTANVSKKRNAANTGWIVKDTLDESFVLSRGSNTILGLSDIYKTILATAGFTQTLTAAATLGDGWGVWFVNTHASAACTLDPNAAETINGAATLSVPAGAGGFIACNGSAFRMVLVPSYDGTTLTTSKLIASGTAAGAIIGASTSAVSLGGIAPNLQVDEVGGVAMGIHRNSADSSAANLVFRKTRSASVGGVTVVQSADGLGNIQWGGTDGTSWIPAAAIEAFVDATPGTNDMPGRLGFYTTADGANSLTERGRIINSGYWKMSNSGTFDSATSATHELDSDGTVVAALVKNSNAAPLGQKILHSTDSNGTANQFLQCIGNATTRAELRSNGGLANFSANNVNLSDLRVKPVFEKYSDSLLDELEDKFLAIERGRFKYADQAHGDWNYGKSAQSVQAVLPELVDTWNPTRTVRTQDDEGRDIDTVEDTPIEEQLLAVHDHDIGEIGEAILARLIRRVRALEARKA